MFLHRSNHAERLVDELAKVVAIPLADPLAEEIIVVQSKGMERWLGMELATRLGVLANARFPFPRHLLSQLDAALIVGKNQAEARFDERSASFAIAALLPELCARPELEPIARYLRADRDGSLRMQLARRIAKVFDDYAVYRPELLLGWQRGKEQSWEALLFRALARKLGPEHQAARLERLILALGSGSGGAQPLPERVCLFGISSMPPLYVQALSALARRIEIHLFVLSPCREYIADLRRPSARRGGGEAADEGHPLLASLGRLGREFQQVLEDHAQAVERDDDLYVDPGDATLLRTVQSDVLALRNRGVRGAGAEVRAIAADDRSIAIHVCHSAMREVEVLHDQLVALLEDASLAPHDIVVMAPDIEAYAPVIEAVFGQKSGRPVLPFSVADRKARSTHEAVDALYELLELAQGRVTGAAVLDLLSLDCVRARFEITSEELDTLRSWVEQSGIRWGIDAAHRASVGQPELQENTFRFGLDRMLLGYAMEGRGARTFAGVLPFDAVSGSSAVLLGKLVELCERLFRHAQALRGPRSVLAWRTALTALLDDFLDEAPSTVHQRTLLQTALGALVAAAERAGFDEPIALRELLGELEGALDERLPARGLLASGITFCQLVPMRSIPFRVVCLIGMNDGAFPGNTTRPSFDRMAAPGERRAGDRNRRDDDRHMFLEALLCARERLIVSYVGRGIHDNRAMPPSVVVGELLDAIAQGFAPEPFTLAPRLQRRAAIEARLCTLHRLHAFSPAYFGQDSTLFSYARHDCDGARSLGRREVTPPWLSRGLRETPEPSELDVDDLVRWLTQPIRTLVRQGLGVHLDDEGAPLPEREPFDFEGLARWKLGDDLLSQAVSGVPFEALLSAARARGVLPLGTVGALALDELAPEVRALAQSALRARDGAELPPLEVDLDVGSLHLTGTLRGLYPAAHAYASFSKLGKRFELAHFVRHLVLGCVLAQRAPRGYPSTSVVVAPKDDERPVAEIRFAPVREPFALLERFCALALQARKAALPFEHDAARAYANAFFGEHPGDGQKALRAARQSFEAKHGGGKYDSYVMLAYPSFDALVHDDGPLGFMAITHALFEPFFAYRSEV